MLLSNTLPTSQSTAISSINTYLHGAWLNTWYMNRLSLCSDCGNSNVKFWEDFSIRWTFLIWQIWKNVVLSTIEFQLVKFTNTVSPTTQTRVQTPFRAFPEASLSLVLDYWVNIPVWILTLLLYDNDGVTDVLSGVGSVWSKAFLMKDVSMEGVRDEDSVRKLCWRKCTS